MAQGIRDRLDRANLPGSTQPFTTFGKTPGLPDPPPGILLYLYSAPSVTFKLNSIICPLSRRPLPTYAYPCSTLDNANSALQGNGGEKRSGPSDPTSYEHDIYLTE
jgi:hypothetical protein